MRTKIVFSAMLLTLVALGGFAATNDDPPAANDAAKKKQQQEADIKKLEEVLGKATMAGDDVTSWVRCNVDPNQKKCDQNDRLYINASQISILELVNVPDKTCIFVMSGEKTGDSLPACFAHAGRVFVAVQKERSFKPSYKNAKCGEGKDCPPEALLNKAPLNQRLNVGLKSVSKFVKDTNGTPTDIAKMPDADFTDEIPLIQYATEGNSSRLTVHAISKDGKTNVVVDVPVAYQPWFMDSGGFLAFTTLVDKEITKHDQGDGTVKIDNVRWSNRLTPNTGLAINFHPANYPNAGIQFALTTVEEKVTYHLGGAYRLRSVGSKAIATVAAGLAVGQVNRFPDIKVGDVRASTDAGLNGTKRWATGAYLSLSFGFTFGNGSGTTTENKKPAVTQPTTGTGGS